MNKDRSNRLMPNGVPRYVRCYDNQGETIDRYTVVFTGRYTHKTCGTFWYLGMNAAPFHPQGIGQHGESMHQPIDRPRYSHLGRKIPFDMLPKDCQQAVIQTYSEIWDTEPKTNS